MKTEKTKQNSILSRILMIVLAIALVFSTFAFVACKDKDTDDGNDGTDDSTEEEVVEELSIGNGKFNAFFGSKEEVKTYPAAPESWNYSIDGSSDDKAPSSKKDTIHGVVSVESDELFNKTENDEKVFGNLGNPKTPNTTSGDKKNILMIYNKQDTAVRYKSPAIVVPRNSYVEISVWVKTVGVNGNDAIEAGKGAHINVVGGVETPVYIKNINTNGITENNGYKKHSIYISANEYQDKTIYLELGLGYGGLGEYGTQVAGYAFFDDVEMNYMTEKDYAQKAASISADNKVQVTGEKGISVDINLNGAVNASSEFNYIFNKVAPSNIDYSKFYPSTSNAFTFAHKAGTTASSSTFDVSTASLTDEVKDMINKDGNYPFSNKSVTQIHNQDLTSSNLISSAFIELEQYKLYRLSFFIKTSDFKAYSGLNIHLIKENPKNSSDYYAKFENINTAASALDLSKEENKKHKLDNWVQYSFVLQSSMYQKEKVKLEFALGAKNVDTNKPFYENQYSKGYAFIANPSFEELTLAEFEGAQNASNTQLANISTTTNAQQTIYNGGFSSPITSQTHESSSNKPLTPSSWVWHRQGEKILGGSGSDLASLAGVDHGIFKNNVTKYSNNTLFENIASANNPFVLGMSSSTNATALAYRYSAAITLQQNSYYMFSFRAYATSNTKFAMYLVDKDGNKLKDGGIYNDKEEQTTAPSDIFVSTAGEGSWKTYTYFFKTGYETKEAFIELWLGNRTEKTTGQVFFDDVMLTQPEKGGKELFEDLFIRDNVFTPEVITANSIMKGVDYSHIDLEKEEEDNTKDETTPAKTKFDWVLLIASLSSLAIVVAFAIIFVVKFLGKASAKRKHKATNNYDESSRDSLEGKKVSKKSKLNNSSKNKFDENVDDFNEDNDDEE